VRGTVTGAPDTGYRIAARLVSPQGLDLSSLRVAGSGGEPVRASTIRDFEARFGVPGVIRPGYGLAEATLTVTVDLSSPMPLCDAAGNVSCGPAVPGIEVRIVDDEGRELPPGVPGEILIRGETVFSGYVNDPEATAEALRDGWLRSGDIGALDREGRLFVHGRRRALIKRAGGTIAPREVEEAADAVPGVRSSAAVGVPNPSLFGTEDIVIVAEVRRGGWADDAAMAAAARAIAHRVEEAVGASPWRVLLVAPNTIPRTANGKVCHARLRSDVVANALPGESLLHDHRD
jgi:acyl-CoA synthetase (AMP-forming)/AMP-acid ligase II